MRMIDTLDKLHAEGVLVRMVAAGILSGSVVVWREAYHKYEQELARTGSKMQAMENVATDFNYSLRTMQYIRDRMECF